MDYIEECPKRYEQWISSLSVLEMRNIDEVEFNNLCNGTCEQGALTYFEQHLVKALNNALNRCIKEFQCEINLYAAMGESENLHIPYLHFRTRINRCLFYQSLTFISQEFRNELDEKITEEISSFWNKACKMVYDACLDQVNPVLENEWYLIRRIHLFDIDEDKYE